MTTNISSEAIKEKKQKARKKKKKKKKQKNTQSELLNRCLLLSFDLFFMIS